MVSHTRTNLKCGVKNRARSALLLNSYSCSALLFLPLLAGYIVGNLVHHKVPQRQFRIAVCVLLVVAGGALVVRNLPALVAMV